MNELKKLKRYPLVILFVVFIIGYFFLDLTSTDRSFSEMENKVLTQKPTLTAKSLIQNEYTLKYEEYINDQFIFRDQWISLKSISESALLKIENNGVTYGSDGYMFEKYPTVDRVQLEKNLGFVQEFLDQNPQLPVTLGVVPNSYALLPQKLPTGFGNVDQLPLIEEMYQTLDAPNLSKVELTAALQGHSDEYIYHRTDHHWTTLGSYYAYVAYAESKGLEPVSLSQLAPLAREVEGFYGTYYSKAKLFGAQDDVITWYDLPVDDVIIDGGHTVRDSYNNEIEVTGLYNLPQFEARDKYAAFLYGNHGLTVIKSSQNQSHTEGETSRVLLLKDSYGNSFAPYLIYNYDEVWVVDLRHMFKFSPILEENDFEDVLLLYNFMNFVQDTNLAKLRY